MKKVTIEEVFKSWPPVFVSSYRDNDIIDQNPSTSVIEEVYKKDNDVVIKIKAFNLSRTAVVVLKKPFTAEPVIDVLRGAVGKTLLEAGSMTL
jgi:hypothetical protein